MSDDAFDEGYEAYEAELSMVYNPYDYGSASYEAWEWGWLAAQAEYYESLAKSDGDSDA